MDASRLTSVFYAGRFGISSINLGHTATVFDKCVISAALWHLRSQFLSRFEAAELTIQIVSVPTLSCVKLRLHRSYVLVITISR